MTKVEMVAGSETFHEKSGEITKCLSESIVCSQKETKKKEQKIIN